MKQASRSGNCDPVIGLRELERVCRPQAEIRLLEHTRAGSEPLGRSMDIANPVVARTMGPNINRRTVQNIKAAGLQVDSVQDLSVQGIFRLIVARPAYSVSKLAAETAPSGQPVE
jgi:hypothetical protein